MMNENKDKLEVFIYVTS